MARGANARDSAQVKQARLIAAVRELLESGDEATMPGFVEVTARAYHELQAALAAISGQPQGIDVRELLDLPHEEEG